MRVGHVRVALLRGQLEHLRVGLGLANPDVQVVDALRYGVHLQEVAPERQAAGHIFFCRIESCVVEALFLPNLPEAHELAVPLPLVGDRRSPRFRFHDRLVARSSPLGANLSFRVPTLQLLVVVRPPILAARKGDADP